MNKDIITNPVANEILFFFIAIKKIKRLIKDPRLINPPNFSFLYIILQESSMGKSDKIKVKNIMDDNEANPPAMNPVKISFLFKIPCI